MPGFWCSRKVRRQPHGIDPLLRRPHGGSPIRNGCPGRPLHCPGRKSKRRQIHPVQYPHRSAAAHRQLARKNRRHSSGEMPPGNGNLLPYRPAGHLFSYVSLTRGTGSQKLPVFRHRGSRGGGMRRHLSGTKSESRFADPGDHPPCSGLRQPDGRSPAQGNPGGSFRTVGKAGGSGCGCRCPEEAERPAGSAGTGPAAAEFSAASPGSGPLSGRH